MLIILFLLNLAHADLLSREFAVVSNFMWRGTTFSENKPAAQVEMIYENNHQTEVGFFFSNAEFSDPAAGSHTTVRQELDLFVMQNFSAGEVIFTPTLSYYSFFDAWFYNSTVYSLMTEYKKFFVELGYMDRFFGYQSTYNWVVVGYKFELPRDEELTVALGSNHFSNPKGSIWENNGEETTSGAGNPDYQDLLINWKMPFENELSLGLSYIWTNRREYSVESGEIELADASDETGVVELIWNF